MFNSQPVEVIPSIKAIRTEVGTTFRTAYKVFNWSKQEEGVSLNPDILKFAIDRGYMINIVVEGESYQISPLVWMEKGSHYNVKGKNLLCIPLSLLEFV